MPRQNRVTPFSEIIAVPARGSLTGNRGCLHDAKGRIVRPYAGRRWIICLLEFKGRKRPLMQPGRYTELFFTDEAAALAAGHRPCAECQREKFERFRSFWASANLPPANLPSDHPAAGDSQRISADAIDAALHRERLARWNDPSSLPTVADLDAALALPDGTFLADARRSAYLLWGFELLRWSFDGYTPINPRELSFPLQMITPPSTVRTLAAGYSF